VALIAITVRMAVSLYSNVAPRVSARDRRLPVREHLCWGKKRDISLGLPGSEISRVTDNPRRLMEGVNTGRRGQRGATWLERVGGGGRERATFAYRLLACQNHKVPLDWTNMATEQS